MFNRVKEYLNEIIDIADKCPEKYQVKCFEVLLSALVKPETLPVGATAGAPQASVTTGLMPRADFFTENDISQEERSRVFYFDGSSWSIIVKNLKVKEKSKKQVSLALLLGIKGLLETNEALLSKNALIDVCRQYVAYDSTNFAKHMKRAKHLLMPKGEGWVLTIPGKEKAAEVIKELAQ